MFKKISPEATTSEKTGPCPFSGVPVTRYPEMGPAAGLQRIVIVLSLTSVTSISDGESISVKKMGVYFYCPYSVLSPVSISAPS